MAVVIAVPVALGVILLLTAVLAFALWRRRKVALRAAAKRANQRRMEGKDVEGGFDDLRWAGGLESTGHVHHCASAAASCVGIRFESSAFRKAAGVTT